MGDIDLSSHNFNDAKAKSAPPPARSLAFLYLQKKKEVKTSFFFILKKILPISLLSPPDASESSR